MLTLLRSYVLLKEQLPSVLPWLHQTMGKGDDHPALGQVFDQTQG